MEALEREEALQEGLAPEKGVLDGPPSHEKQSEHAAKLEGYLDGEIEDLFDAGHMQE